MSNLTPEQLFSSFQITTNSWEKQLKIGLKAIEDFKDVPNKKDFLKPAIQFIKAEEQDKVRSWGTSILQLIGGDQAFEFLISLLNKEDTQETKRTYQYTRFFALLALNRMQTRQTERERVENLCEQLWMDEAEHYLIQAEAAAFLANKRQSEPMGHLEKMLTSNNYYQVVSVLRALLEVPVDGLVEKIIPLMNAKEYNMGDLRWYAIRAAGSFKNQNNVLFELGRIARDEPIDYLRLEAVKSLGRLGNPMAREHLLFAIQDDDAEIRCKAAIAMQQILPPEAAAKAIIEVALDTGTNAQQRNHLVDSLRVIDSTRTIPTNILSNELSSEDHERAETAEKLLLDLGGWAAVQRLSQRRLTLNQLDNLLSESEKVVHNMFQGTIRQARFNFYFAMTVNMIIVLTGMILVGIAIWQLLVNPDNLASWILPGATGLFGVLINLLFNNPRRNAREDLDILMGVTVKFFGFLRRLNEIDATFKYLYLEATDFNTDLMRETLLEIQRAVTETLASFTNQPSSVGKDQISEPAAPETSEQKIRLDPAPT